MDPQGDESSPPRKRIAVAVSLTALAPSRSFTHHGSPEIEHTLSGLPPGLHIPRILSAVRLLFPLRHLRGTIGSGALGKHLHISGRSKCPT